MKIGFNLGDTAYTHLYAPMTPKVNPSLSANATTPTTPHSPKGPQSPKGYSSGLMIVEGTVVDYTRLQLQGKYYQIGVILRMKNTHIEIPFPLSALSATVEGARAILERNLQPLDA